MDIQETVEALRHDPKLMAQIAKSPSGKKLMAMLEESGQWEQTAKKARQGEVQAIAGLLKQVVAAPEGRMLLEQLSKELQK